MCIFVVFLYEIYAVVEICKYDTEFRSAVRTNSLVCSRYNFYTIIVNNSVAFNSDYSQSMLPTKIVWILAVGWISSLNGRQFDDNDSAVQKLLNRILH